MLSDCKIRFIKDRLRVDNRLRGAKVRDAGVHTAQSASYLLPGGVSQRWAGLGGVGAGVAARRSGAVAAATAAAGEKEPGP